MYRYNVVVEQGLYFLETEKYVDRLSKNPDWIHRNLGSFYSETSPESLAVMIYNSFPLESDFLGRQDLNFVHEHPRNVSDENYLVDEKRGARIILSSDREKLYEDLAVHVASCLGHSEKKGGLQEAEGDGLDDVVKKVLGGLKT